MNKRGFTLVELLATLVVLAIIVGIVLISTTGSLGRTKQKTEEVFVKTLKDALDIYIDSDAKSLNFDTQVCTIDKTHKTGVKVYKTSSNLTFSDVINSNYHPISESDMHNPANKGTRNYECKTNGTLNIYRDEDYVYYYKIAKDTFGCLNDTGVITNLPSGCDD